MELDFTNELLERVLVKKSLVDKRFLNAISPLLDVRWFEGSKALGVVAKLIVKYFNAYDAIPTPQIVQAMVQKYCQIHTEIKQADVMRELTEVSRLEVDLSLDVVKKNLEKFVKRKMLYYTTSDIAVDIVNNGSADKYIDELEKIAGDIEQEAQNSLEREISSEQIGEMVMKRLKDVDEVAYVRFASVYRQFKDINTFMDELNRLLNEK